jgi:hypothetical protein
MMAGMTVGAQHQHHQGWAPHAAAAAAALQLRSSRHGCHDGLQEQAVVRYASGTLLQWDRWKDTASLEMGM